MATSEADKFRDISEKLNGSNRYYMVDYEDGL